MTGVHKASRTLGDNMGLVSAVIAVVVAQALKPFSEWAITGRFKPSLAVSSGGFPSSHSALVTALATGAAYQVGLADPAFAATVVLALVVGKGTPGEAPSPSAPVTTRRKIVVLRAKPTRHLPHPHIGQRRYALATPA